MSLYSVSNTKLECVGTPCHDRESVCWAPEYMDADSSGMLDETEIFLAMRRLGYCPYVLDTRSCPCFVCRTPCHDREGVCW